MINKVTIAKTIGGIDVEEFFGRVAGPMAANLLEMKLCQMLNNKGEGMTGAELKLLQFVIERSYGTATRSLEVTRVSDQEIVVEKLGALDPAILRQIAGTNARRDSDPSID